MKRKIVLKQIKKFTTLSAAAIACMLLVTSCNKDSDSSSTSATVSTDEAAEAVTDAVTPESGGMVSQVNNSVVIVTNYGSPCGLSFDSSISGQNSAGSIITYSYNLEWNWVLSCAKAEFDFNFKGHSMYDAPRMSSNDSSTGAMVITGLENSSNDYVVNTDYIRNGSQQSKILNKNSFTSKITITSTNIKVDKSTLEIVSGTSTVSINGASTSGRTFSYTGTITFNGNKSATLVLGNGSSYDISW